MIIGWAFGATVFALVAYNSAQNAETKIAGIRSDQNKHVEIMSGLVSAQESQGKVLDSLIRNDKQLVAYLRLKQNGEKKATD